MPYGHSAQLHKSVPMPRTLPFNDQFLEKGSPGLTKNAHINMSKAGPCCEVLSQQGPS